MPSGLSFKAEWTKGHVLIIFCFVFTIHASSSGYFCLSWVCGACWNAGRAPCLQKPVTGDTCLPGNVHSGTVRTLGTFLKWSITTATAGWGGTCDSGGTTAVCREKTELHHVPGRHWHSLPSFLCAISSRPEKVVMINWIDWHFEPGHRLIHKTQCSW